MERLSIEDQFAGRQFIDTRQHLHQRGLACAILSHDRMDLASAQSKVDVLDCGNAAERLGRLTELEDWAHRSCAPTSARSMATMRPDPFAAT
jgi:hypothetical protein